RGKRQLLEPAHRRPPTCSPAWAPSICEEPRPAVTVAAGTRRKRTAGGVTRGRASRSSPRVSLHHDLPGHLRGMDVAVEEVRPGAGRLELVLHLLAGVGDRLAVVQPWRRRVGS